MILPEGAAEVELVDAVGNAPGVMATRGQSDMRGFGSPHDRLVRRERRSSRVERGRIGCS